MENGKEKIERLIRRKMLGVLSEAETRELEAWLAEGEGNRRLFERIVHGARVSEELPLFCRLDEEEAWERFRQQVQRGKRGRRRSLVPRWWRVAAAAVVVIGVGVAVWMQGGTETKPVATTIVPGSSQATLVVADGKTIALETGAGESVVEVTAGQEARRKEDVLVYDTAGGGTEAEVFNTLTTPRGGEFKLMLSDGTLVHLNADTRLRYPVAFVGKERRVFLSGEAYFEVATDSTRPFYVETGDVQVRVYGTEFDVNTYREGETRAVLVEGRVGVKPLRGRNEVEMKPGELLTYERATKTMRVERVDVRSYVAWKEGYFAFENETLEEVMERLALWYNVEVFFQSEQAKAFEFTGFMRRYEEIDTIMTAIRDVTGVHYSINGRTVVIGI